uniref:galactose oxidase-like domain-containing protein n=1 Tax=uncultured Hoeflea sp. TaxID=538666 RepID=UPI0030DACE0C
MAQVEQSSIDNEQIDGAFALAVDVRFDNLGSSSGQKVFELSSGDGADKIWFGQIGTGSDLEFVLVQDGVEYRTIAKGAIQEGELVTWRIGIDPDGVMRISNDTEVIAQGAGVVPKDIDRPLAAYGEDMEGSISDLKIANYGNLAELDPTNPDSPCALTGESACLCGVLRPTDEHVEGERGSIVISDTDTQGDGEWSNVVALTIIPIHAVVLPDGKVFTFGSTEAGGQGGDFVYSLFDPETGVEKVLENTTGTNIFCSNLALDPETGNVIIFGGDGNRNGGGGISGIDSVTVFDYRTQTMSEAEPMDYARWYPSNITLSNGDILVLGGRDKDYLGSTIPEIYDGETGTFRQLTGADMPDLFGGSGGNLDESWWYPHVWENSKGEVIVIEASGNDIYRLDTDGLGSVAKIGQTGFESYKLNSSLLYGNDKVAIIGDDGGIYTADISDLSTAPVFTKVATLENARTNATMISLPDGRVLVVGGSTPFGDNTDQGNGLTNAIYTPTIWDPSDNSLEQGEAQALARLYHSSGLLLPDGSIWSGGGGAPGPLVNTNVEFFRPDYMYDADGNLAQRPEITEAPKNIGAGDTFQITVDDSSDIEMLTAIRSGGMTHARNSDARFVELQFTVVDATTIEITTPDAFILGPGAWMLYAVDAAGVPSEAAIVGVDMADIVETPPLEQTTLQYYGIDREQITGAFELTVEARFDDLGAGEWQRIFDFGNGPAKDNIWLGQVAGTNDMRFEVWVGGTNYAITAVGAIEEGVRADWKVSVDESGYMRMWKNGVAVAEAQGAVPADVERSQDFIGDSNWITDQRLVGEVRNLEIENGTPDPDTPPKVSVTSTGDVVEGAEGEDGTLNFVFSLSHVTTEDVVINYNILGSATGPESVTIEAGQSEVSVALTFTGDDIQELDELVTVEILSATNARLGNKTDISATATILDDDVQSTPAGMSFFAEAIVRFDDLGGGNWQRVFDYGDGPDNNNIWLGQVAGSNEMRFEILDGPTKYAIEAVDGIVEGETARWTAQITSDGTMQLFKDGVLVAEGEGIVPPDVERPSKLVGSSNWGGDTPLIGEVIAITVDEDGSDEVAAPVISIAAPADALEGAAGETGTLSY